MPLDIEIAATCGQRLCGCGKALDRQGRSSACRSCNMRAVRQSEPLKYATDEERRAANNASARRYWARHKEERAGEWKARRRAVTLARYGLSPTEFDALLAAQGNGCAICGATDPQHWSGRFQVDHDHDTGAVRGLLCAPCNRGLGHFGDDASTLELALAYLRKAGG